MPETISASLTGVWRGRFSYPYDLPPGDFVAVLFQTGDLITGTTHEADLEGGSSEGLLFATLEGRRSGASVNFRKTYDGSGGRSHTVHYCGVLSPDGAEIAGEWTVPCEWSGPFVMIRAAGKPQTVERAAEATV